MDNTPDFETSDRRVVGSNPGIGGNFLQQEILAYIAGPHPCLKGVPVRVTCRVLRLPTGAIVSSCLCLNDRGSKCTVGRIVAWLLVEDLKIVLYFFTLYVFAIFHFYWTK